MTQQRKNRTDQILDLLDAGLQETTARHHGADAIGSLQDMCVGCVTRPPIEGRSWCAECLPERDDHGIEAEPPTLPLGIRPPFELNVPISDREGIYYVASMCAITIGDDPAMPAVAGVYLDENEQPVGIGISPSLIPDGQLNVLHEIGLLVIRLMSGADPHRAIQAWTEVQILALGLGS